MRTPDDASPFERDLAGYGQLSPASTSTGSTRTGRDALRRKRGFLQWLTRGAALREARASVRELDARTRELRRRAQLACELADRLYDPIDALRAGSGAPLAVDLYRQASYWAMCALQPDTATKPAAELWNASQAHIHWAVPDAEQRDRLRTLLVDDTFVEIANRAQQEQAELMAAARALAHASIEALDHPKQTVNRLLLQRLVRIALLVFVALGATLGGLWTHDRLNHVPDLAAGKPWRASSTWAPCEPSVRRCGSLRTDIFFHTAEDATPWLEYDLRAPTRFSSIFVRNRTDAAPDRAIPLMIEVSNDRKVWREVARRKESFRTWTAHFKPQTARYLRLRVARRSYLHLEKVMVHR